MAKNNSEMKSIRKKLVAAVAMVLVASVMVVSSSYAWFTLSTAPEVTGIQTSVGANGNLEMALRTVDLTSIGTAVGQSFPTANNYWGNLVDLSHPDYHLDGIALRPAGLNVVQVPGTGVTEYKKDADGKYLTNAGGTEQVLAEWWNAQADNEGKQIADATKVSEDILKQHGIVASYKPAEYQFENVDTIYLRTPTYGTDGRVSAITPNTTHGTYVPGKGFVENKGAHGVLGIGTISGLTPEQLALRDARLAVTGTAGRVTTAAQTSLQSDAVKIANIAVKHKLNGAATFEKELADVKIAIDNLQAITVQLEAALKKAVVAVGVAQKLTFTEAEVTLTTTDITLTGAAATLDWSKAPQGSKQSIIDAYNIIVRMNNDLTEAETAANSATATPSYTEMVAIVTKVLNPGDIKIDGLSVDALMGNVADAAMILTGNPTISIEKGIYADIALFVENYSVSTSIRVDGEFSGVGSIHDNFPVTMITDVAQPEGGYYLTGNIIGWMNGLTIDTVGGGTDVMIGDLYAYMLDLAFRTNATGSNLLLQSAPANRVNDSAATQGAGSYMEFTSGHIDFSIVQMGQLRENIRVVFVGEDGKILAVAALEVFKDTGVAYVEGTEGHLFAKNGNAMTWANGVVADENTKNVKAKLYLYDFTVNATDGSVALTAKSTNQSITALQQNVATGVSTLVYLDGHNVENKDVAISGESMSGTMNLQFASSATLTPMDYTFQDKLAAPSIAIDAVGQMTITPAENTTPEKYDIYVGNTRIEDVTGTTFDLTTYNSAQRGGQTVQISVVAKAANKADSDKSAAVQYTFPPFGG